MCREKLIKLLTQVIIIQKSKIDILEKRAILKIWMLGKIEAFNYNGIGWKSESAFPISWGSELHFIWSWIFLSVWMEDEWIDVFYVKCEDSIAKSNSKCFPSLQNKASQSFDRQQTISADTARYPNNQQNCELLVSALNCKRLKSSFWKYKAPLICLQW